MEQFIEPGALGMALFWVLVFIAARVVERRDRKR